MSNTGFSINNLDLLEEVSEREVMRICSDARDETFDKPYLLYIPNNALDKIFVVKTGEVQLYHLHNGKRVVFDTLGPGDLFGNFSTETVAATHFAEAGKETRVCAIPVKQFLKIVSEHPEMLLKTLKIMARRLTEYENRISLCPAPAKMKVLQELRRYQKKRARRMLGRSGGGVRMTHQKIAHLTGLNRVTVTRALQELEVDGALRVDEKTGAYFTEE